MALPIIAAAAAGQGMGMIAGKINDARQLEQNRKLMQQQIEGGKALGRFNQELAMKTWEETNYSAQRQQMEKAGINPGLMYGGAGSGGTTSGGQAQLPSTSTAPAGGGELGMGMQMGLSAMMMEAQIENTKAQTANIEQDTANKAGGEGTAGVQKEKLSTEIENIAAQTKNTATQTALNELQQEIMEVERKVKAGTQEDAIDAIKSATRSAIVKANIDERTQAQTIKQLNRATQEQALRIEAQRKGLIKQDVDIKVAEQQVKQIMTAINNAVQENMREWDKLSIQEREQIIRQSLGGNASEQDIRGWIETITSVVTKIK